ncbi:MAG: hypothetical protein HOC09_14895 [Deltaproteobacteria bacterium]|nr:hypothetical protein [Deltaproteobacteria bacterium]
MTQILDPGFSRFSYGFRAGKSAHQAVYQLREYIREGYRIAIDTDLSKFFDTVEHDVLMVRVSRKVQDKQVKSERAGHRVMSSIKAYLERELKLKINQEKSQVVAVSKASFLGFTFKGTKIRWTDKAFKEFIRRIKLYTGRSWFVSMDVRFKKLAQYLSQSRLGYRFK